MGNGLTLDGSSYVYNTDETDMLDGTDHMRERDWSFETWVKPSDSSATQPVFFVGDGDGVDNEDEFQIGIRDLAIELCFNDCDAANDEYIRYTGSPLSDDTWTHIAVVWDASEVGHEVYIDGLRITGQDDTSLIWNSHSSFPTAGQTEYYLGKGDIEKGSNGVENFVGMLDDARFSEYARGAFAGGLMFSEVIPGSDTIKIYNSGSAQMDLTGIEIWGEEGTSRCSVSGFGFTTLNAGTESSAISCDIDPVDGIYMVDADGDNSDGLDPGFLETAKAWIIDGVCWNTGSGTDPECNSLSDPMIQAGVWGVNTYVHDIGDSRGIFLASAGDNDEAVDDWTAIPEFSTLMMPIASVLMIIGYNYRRRNNLEA
jgi:hypothetical protein